MIQRNSMIPRYSMIQIPKGIPIRSMDFDNPKVCSDTSIFDGLVFKQFSLLLYFLSDSYLYCDSWYYQLCGVCSTQSVLPLLSCMFVLGAAALRWLPWSTMVPLIDWWHPPARRLSPTVIVSLPILQLWLCPPLMCLLRVPASQDVESHWLHLSGFSPLWVIADNQLLRFQCSDCLPALAQGWLWGQKLHASWT